MIVQVQEMVNTKKFKKGYDGTLESHGSTSSAQRSFAVLGRPNAQLFALAFVCCVVRLSFAFLLGWELGGVALSR